ncbi:MAG: type II toxin-antitoxin system RelE/ParE family toxin [Nitrospirae bacterium]|nr:type II toxin-antitoxin system RelE/ParE family toxin [Nitrospirota bacterium]
MEFSVEFYESPAGRCPVREFLEELRTDDPDDFAAVMAGLVKLRQRRNHRPPISKPVGGGLFELRHVGKLNSRVMYFFVRGRRIVTVHGIRNKARDISPRDRVAALERMRDWRARNEA